MVRLQRLFFRSCAIIAVLISMGAFPVMPVSAANDSFSTLTFAPLADASVRQVFPNMNYGAEADLRARSNPAVRSYLQFAVSGLGGRAILHARLQVFANSSSLSGLVVRPVRDNSWGEMTITYANAPAAGVALRTSPAVLAGTWITLDVTKYVKAEGTYSLALTSPGTTPIILGSRESGPTTPRLVVTLDTWQPSFPIRATFYYPWFPEAWKQKGIYPYTHYQPVLSYYSSTDPTVLAQHLAMMQYANIQAGIASWWGPKSQTDTKIADLLTAAAGTDFRWSLYYEGEAQGDPSVLKIRSDLFYIRNHYGMDPNFLRINGKFVIFVYSDGGDGCGMVDRWKQANTVGAYVVLKVFPGYASCSRQPSGWHQYAPALAASQQGSQSYSISPGFWLMGHRIRLARNPVRWQQNVRDMVASGARWQLITTFSEWGEGTAVEPALQWASPSGYGVYLDALHYNGNMP